MSNSPLIKRLTKKKILVSDGAWGTQLQQQGLAAGECPEAWNLTHPEKVEAVARAYVDAGSDIILTNTFGGSRFKLEQYGLADKTSDINQIAVELSRNAAKANTFVVASIGPTGKFVEPLGDVTPDAMMAAFREQVAAHVVGGADAILIETMSDLTEATLAIRAVKAVCSLPVLTTMTFEKGSSGYRTMMGISVEQAVTTLSEAGADVIGTNCGNGIEQICEIIAETRSFTDKFLIAQPNAGKPKLVGEETIFEQSPEEFAAHVPNLIRAGANIIGGCCGTTPNHIQAIVDVVRKFSKSKEIG
ncbi:homocysteine S-methyltransferase family protein [candidate division KSB1 bacterium]|nr:homocysteine S-methyltransferase family protein [candidate division KSB1 bacterium]